MTTPAQKPPKKPKIVRRPAKNSPVLAKAKKRPKMPPIDQLISVPVPRRKNMPLGANQHSAPVRTPQIRQAIIEMFAIGLPWREVAVRLGTSPEIIRKWMWDDPEFMAKYREAKDFAADRLVDEIEAHADDAATVETDEEGNLLPGEREKATRLRTAIEGKKIAAQLRAPKRFGNLLKLADADGEKLTIQVANWANADIRPPIDGDAEDITPLDP